jgi:hypothetical protein
VLGARAFNKLIPAAIVRSGTSSSTDLRSGAGDVRIGKTQGFQRGKKTLIPWESPVPRPAATIAQCRTCCTHFSHGWRP